MVIQVNLLGALSVKDRRARMSCNSCMWTVADHADQLWVDISDHCHTICAYYSLINSCYLYMAGSVFGLGASHALRLLPVTIWNIYHLLRTSNLINLVN